MAPFIGAWVSQSISCEYQYIKNQYIEMTKRTKVNWANLTWHFLVCMITFYLFRRIFFSRPKPIYFQIKFIFSSMIQHGFPLIAQKKIFCCLLRIHNLGDSKKKIPSIIDRFMHKRKQNGNDLNSCTLCMTYHQIAFKIILKYYQSSTKWKRNRKDNWPA